MEAMTQEIAGDTAVAGANASSRQLHDRATRGDTLTEAEQGSLAAWYGHQDAEDGAMLASAAPVMEGALRHLREEVEAAAARVLATTQQIQAQIAENDALRQEIAALSQRLVQPEAT